MKSGEKLYSIILANLLKRERLIGINTLTNQQDMTRSELSKEIIPKISDYLFSKNFIDNATHDDAEDNILMSKFDIACDILSVEASYQRLLGFLKDSLANTDTISS